MMNNMKTKFLVLAFGMTALVSVQTFAQNWFAGGSVSYTTNPREEHNLNYDYYSFSATPTVGYQINDSFDVRAVLSFSRSDDKRTYPNPVSNYHYLSTSYGINAGAGFTLLRWENLSLLGVGLIGYSKSSSETTNGTTKTTTNGNSISVSLRPEAQYRLNERVSLTATLGGISYSKNWGDNAQGDTSGWSFFANLSTNLGLGFRVLF
jgi:hypothetical protein